MILNLEVLVDYIRWKGVYSFFVYGWLIYASCMTCWIFGRYLSIVKEEGLEISQPALDPTKSEVHHPLTVHKAVSKVHRLTLFPQPFSINSVPVVNLYLY